MSIEVSWDNEYLTLLRWDCNGEWRWAETAAAAEVTQQLRDTARHIPRIAVLLDMTRVDSVPRDSLRSIRRLFQFLASDDLILFIGSSLAISILIDFVRTSFPAQAEQLFTAPDLSSGRALALEVLAARSSPA